MAARKPKKEKAKEIQPKKEILEPLEFDPLNPELSVLHRAGIAGLLLQIRSMEKLKKQSSEEEGGKLAIPGCSLLEDGRRIRVELTKDSFYSLMKERYRAVPVKRTVSKETHKRRQQKAKRFVFTSAAVGERYEYLEPRPSLTHFELFEAHSCWQEHARDAAWQSYYCIYKTQLAFKLSALEQGNSTIRDTWQTLVNKEGEKTPVIDDLWTALVDQKEIELRKQYYPGTFGENLKSVSISESGQLALLLHFWPLVAVHFTPINLKFDKDSKALRYDRQAPIVVVPDVVDAQAFVEEFIDYLGCLDVVPEGKLNQDGRFVATPLEASLAFFAAPRLARGVNRKPGTRGAEVYVFKQRPKQDKQPVVTAIVNESFSRRLVDEYKRLMERKITSLPFRAVCVENLLAQPQHHLYEGFEKLVEQYPLELFVATKTEGGKARRFKLHGYWMAQSLYSEFAAIEKQQRRKPMKEEPTIPYLIWRITRNYVRWRACAKAEPAINAEKLKSIFAKKRTDLNEAESGLLKDYNEKVAEVVEKLFIDFRGYRDATTFANAFSETFFRAPQSLSPENAERLRPYYEGSADWESGRRLVLMAISAAGALASSRAEEGDADNLLETDSDETE